MNVVDLTGRRFGRLLVIERADSLILRQPTWPPDHARDLALPLRLRHRDSRSRWQPAPRENGVVRLRQAREDRGATAAGHASC